VSVRDSSDASARGSPGASSDDSSGTSGGSSGASGGSSGASAGGSSDASVRGSPGADSGWLERLVDLSDEIRAATREALVEAVRGGTLERLARAAGQGAGDVTYGIDVPAEHAVDRWLEETARATPLSLLTEDAGWRHRGPDGEGGVRALEGFGHGGPRISVDPIDGTRVLMCDLRPAWSVIGLAGPGPFEPRIGEVVAGVLSEIPDSRAARYRRLSALRGEGCRLEERELEGDRLLLERRLDAGADDRVDHGIFSFFKYMPAERPRIASIEAAFFARLAADEKADVRACFDDQYTSNGGQLALLALGTYRMIADVRAHLFERTLTSKPYDVAGAVICAQEAGAIVTAVGGSPLDFPLDVTTPVSFVGWANRRTEERLSKHLAAVLRST
jgi:fructose-1,6-bisphosphatase/inositol monophosphatase family enzyme